MVKPLKNRLIRTANIQAQYISRCRNPAFVRRILRRSKSEYHTIQWSDIQWSQRCIITALNHKKKI